MRQKKTVVFSLLDTLTLGETEEYLFSHLFYLMQHGYEIVLATNNSSIEKEFLARLSARDKKRFHIVLAPYRLVAIGSWQEFLKFIIVLPTAYIWCETTIKHLKKDYNHVICLWSGFSDRLAFSGITKKYKCSLIWIEISPLEILFKKSWGFPRLWYRFASKYPVRVIATSVSTKKSILNNTRFSQSDITLVYSGSKSKPKKKYQELMLSVIKSCSPA